MRKPFLKVFFLPLLVLALMTGGCRSETGMEKLAVGQRPQAAPQLSAVGKNAENQPLINPRSQTAKQQVALYFANEDETYLVPELREVQCSKEKLPEIIIRELVKGPENSELRGLLPKTAKLISLEVWGGTAYVNFARNIEEDYVEGPDGEALLLLSVVNSLTELENISKVQFLLDGKKVDSFRKGKHNDLSKPIYRDMSYFGTFGILDPEKYSVFETEQWLADQGERGWRLDPLATAQETGPLCGLYVNGEYQLIAQKEAGQSGRGEATVLHTFGGETFVINLIQPVQNGDEGIWAIQKIRPVGTRDEAITKFLENRYWRPNFGGKVFCAYEVFRERDYETMLVVDIWAYCQEYLPTENGLAEKSGVSTPLSLIIFNAYKNPQAEKYRYVEGVIEPWEGAEYEPSIKRIFAPEVQKKILARSKNIEPLQEEARKKAMAYFAQNGLEKKD